MKKNNNQNRILIVEDDAIVASQLQRTIIKMGYLSVGPVPTGAEAIELALMEYPDAILMDIKLKGELTGIDAAEKIHEESEIPVIYLTAYADHETIERSKDSHTYGFLTKPVRDNELGAMIETAIYKSTTDKSLAYLNQLLRAVRNIDKLITRESVPEKLLSEACEILVNSKDYIVTWISNENDPSSNPMVFSEKFSKSFKGGIQNHFIKQKIQNILSVEIPRNKPLVLREEECSDFFGKIFQEHELNNLSCLIAPMVYREKFYGYLTIFSNSRFTFDAEETELLQTLADDLAFALKSIEAEKERILAEQALAERESYFRTLLHSMHEDIIVIDKDYTITDANNSVLKTTGFLTKDIIGKKCHQISHNSNVPCCDNGETCELQNVFEKGTAKLVRHIHQQSDGTPIYVDVLFSPLKDETGKVTKVIESIHNVTDLLSTQQALTESEERIKQIADNIDIVLFTLISNKFGEKLTYLSPAFDRVWGINHNAVLDNMSLWIDSIYPKDKKNLFEAIRAAKSQPNFVGRIEYRIVRPDGNTRWISSSIKSVNAVFSRQPNIIGIAEDITERILTENKLKRSEQAYKSLFDNAQNPILIIEPERGVILNINLKACEAYGYDKSDLIGKTFYELCTDEKLIFEKINNAAGNSEVPTFEIEAIKKDKSIVYFEVNLSQTDYLGHKAVISINNDITFRKHAEKELRFLSEIVKQSPVSVLLSDINNKVEYVNPRYTELTGTHFKDIVGKEVTPLTPADNQNINEIWSVVKSGDVWNGEMMKSKNNRDPYWTALSISPIKDNDGKIGHYLSIEQDITQQKELEIELKLALTKANEINVFKTHLLGNLNHEIRTPMNSIIGFAQIMVEEAADDDIVEMSNKIVKSSHRLLNTLNSIIELSDLESQRIKVHETDINIPHFVRYLDYSYRSIASEKNLKLEIELEKEDLIIKSDEKLLEQVLRNLIDNAIKYTEQGNIIIGASEVTDNNLNHYCALSVKDSGIGIPEKNRNIIFDAFRQLSEGVTRRYEGTGLGLTIAQKMILLLGGKLEVKSDIGEGSTFTVLIPMPVTQIVQEVISEPEVVTESKEAILSNNKPNILIVEDYLMNVDIMKYFLNDIARMNNTTNYEETMVAVSNDKYDLILMDINLKDSIGGIELMKELRKLDSYKQIPIIAITGYTSSIDQDTFMREGFTGFLAKPFNQKQLRDIIIRHLS
jgi:PAS domain S-box-containing protein